jgi:hypothetical protein
MAGNFKHALDAGSAKAMADGRLLEDRPFSRCFFQCLKIRVLRSAGDVIEFPDPKGEGQAKKNRPTIPKETKKRGLGPLL